METALTASPEETPETELLDPNPQEQPPAEQPPVPDSVPDPRLKLHPQFRSRFLPDDRDIVVYLPPNYDEQPKRRFPVLYMHDGQNLFDPTTSFVPGRTWKLGETADRLIQSNAIEPLIIVGIYNTPRRMDEYTHARERKMQGGNADSYGRFITRELKPFIDSEYRALPDSGNTALGGSSLGGLVTLYLGLKHAETFSKLAVLSPSIWWNHKSIIGYANEYEGPPWPKIWLSMGSEEARRAQPDADLLYRRLVTNGWQAETNIHYERVPGGAHDENAWAVQVSPMLRFLFPAVN